jgi:formate-dependent nitrite reductase membrane component NrfD
MTQSSAKYERLIGDLRQQYRPQRDWGEGRGVFLVVGHFVVGVAAGTWLFSLYFGQQAGLLVGLVLAGLGGLAHLKFLGRPGRVWRMATAVRTSWISRGFIGLNVFLLGALLYLVPLYVPGLWGADSGLASLGWGLALIGMVVMLGYMGFCYTSAKAIPFWHSPLHPALYVAYGLRGGVAALLILLWATGGEAELASRLLPAWAWITAVVVVFFLLEIHSAMTGGNEAARRSVRELFAGRVALYFYVGTLALGLIVPAYLASAGLSGPVSLGTMALIGIASAIGDFFMKFSTVRAGVHLPAWTRLSLQR